MYSPLDSINGCNTHSASAPNSTERFILIGGLTLSEIDSNEMDEGAILLDAKLTPKFPLVDMVGRVVDRLLAEPLDTIQE